VGDYKLIRLREDRYRFEPTQVEADFLVCDTADWVLVIPITREREVVFVRQYRHGIQRVVLEIPGGVCDPGESPEGAAARELREETGFEAGSSRYVGPLMPNAALNNARCHVVVAKDCRLAGAPAPDPLEQLDVVLRPLDDVPAMIRSGELSHALVIAAFACAGRVDLSRLDA
jgi:8-oxo-dGTP pyrophosphatase MutT (NUDIX family)